MFSTTRSSVTSGLETPRTQPGWSITASSATPTTPWRSITTFNCSSENCRCQSQNLRAFWWLASTRPPNLSLTCSEGRVGEVGEVEGDAQLLDRAQQRQGGGRKADVAARPAAVPIRSVVGDADCPQAELVPLVDVIGGEHGIGAFHAQDVAEGCACRGRWCSR